MKRRLIVMRHAKSSWAEPGVPDHDRPLNGRGRESAPKVAKKLIEIEWQPEFVLSSDATRTRETFGLMSEEFSDDVDFQFLPELYLSGIREVVSHVSNVSIEVQTAMVLGHNPGWEYVVQHLSGEGVVMKTGAAALLELDADDWNEAMRSAGTWKLVDVIYPRELN
ncbi:histidine phosphatase family protein [Planctomycetota bacterium]